MRRIKFKKMIMTVLLLSAIMILLTGCGQSGASSTGLISGGSDAMPQEGSTAVLDDGSVAKSPADSSENSTSGPTAEKISVVCTTFPQYDWIRNIIGDRADAFDLRVLISGGVDLHSFQPTVDDIVAINESDMFIYVGGESDLWVGDVINGNQSADTRMINMLEALGDLAKEEVLPDGAEEEDHDQHAGEEAGEEHHEDEVAGEEHHEDEEPGEEHHEDEVAGEEHHEDEEAGEEHHEDEETGEEHHEGVSGAEHDEHEEVLDEHVWLSLKNAQVLCDVISNALASMDPANADIYAANAGEYCARLSSLDKESSDTISECPGKTLLFGDRFPFRYMTDDYGLSYYAAFVGCSAETEASFETIVYLSDKVEELGLKYVTVTESADQSIARTIVGNTTDKDQQILVLDAIQTVTPADIDAGFTYLGAMENNLSVLRTALS